MRLNASSSFSIRCARLVSGPIAMIEHRSSELAAQTRNLAFSAFESTFVFQKSFPPRPTPATESNGAPAQAQARARPDQDRNIQPVHMLQHLTAFSAPICTGAFPHTTVMPTTSISFAVNAIMMARLSSMPGSQSMMTFFLIQHPFFQKKTLQRKTSQSHDMLLHM